MIELEGFHLHGRGLRLPLYHLVYECLVGLLEASVSPSLAVVKGLAGEVYALVYIVGAQATSEVVSEELHEHWVALHLGREQEGLALWVAVVLLEEPRGFRKNYGAWLGQRPENSTGPQADYCRLAWKCESRLADHEVHHGDSHSRNDYAHWGAGVVAGVGDEAPVRFEASAVGEEGRQTLAAACVAH